MTQIGIISIFKASNANYASSFQQPAFTSTISSEIALLMCQRSEHPFCSFWEQMVALMMLGDTKRNGETSPCHFDIHVCSFNSVCCGPRQHETTGDSEQTWRWDCFISKQFDTNDCVTSFVESTWIQMFFKISSSYESCNYNDILLLKHILYIENALASCVSGTCNHKSETVCARESRIWQCGSP